ncbi:Predicted arabinose efflux permease, MFS family [Paenimyroides ummariense]|uniref:Predicted arabinose efflux permease, MFS family n=1 Tax=Paenimyroides ummariense TaxID=913024 RepID=A0A1I4WIH3_9FLAO|nr:MFS transporter [Paenimyroides ummariense]SFN13016.1 Predicted arabinose efflux permease, MFS family [Paenimyroides ummariense]
MEIKEQNILTKPILWFLTISTGLIVANIYYNQPLLGLIAKDFDITESKAVKIAMLTQMGYALGLFLIIPLGDKIARKKLILFSMFLTMLFLLTIATVTNLMLLYVVSFALGVVSVVPQLFIPMVAELSTENTRTQNIGMVMSGLLIGILASRMISGIVGDYFGWRFMFYIALGLMILTTIFIYLLLPQTYPHFKGSYISLLKSVAHFAKTEPVLQLASLRGALSAIFTTLVFHLEEAPFLADASVAGMFGLVGAVGAVAAASVGRFTRYVSKNTIISVSLLIILLSWMFTYFAGYTYWGLIVGFILIDFGLQSSHIMNQSVFFAINIKATNRLNTVYMVSYFLGGSLGTLLGAIAWEHYGWAGVCCIGVIFTVFALLAHISLYKKVER